MMVLFEKQVHLQNDAGAGISRGCQLSGPPESVIVAYIQEATANDAQETNAMKRRKKRAILLCRDIMI
jgi:hypothetical protein